MRIVLDARTIQDHFPGIARYTYNLAVAMADVMPLDDLLLIYDPSQQNSRFNLDTLRAKSNVNIVECSAPNFSLREQVLVPAVLRRKRAALYHSPYYIMPYLLPCPGVVTIHDLVPMLYPHYFTVLQRLAFAATLRLAIGTARRIVTDSVSTARDLARLTGAAQDRITVVAAAADPSLHRPESKQVAEVVARYNLPVCYILYVGSNKPHKNLSRLIEAFSKVERRTRYPLVVAGHWEPRQSEAKAMAEKMELHNLVRWIGPVPPQDLAAIYSGAALFVFPSEYEGFGLPVLEAMACGIPVLCSNSSSLPEVAGDAARLLDPHDTVAWTQAIDDLLSDESARAELAERGQRRAAGFSWTASARQMRSVYVSL